MSAAPAAARGDGTPGGGAPPAAADAGPGPTPLDLPLAASGAVFIEASAGTGKTNALTTLVVRLVMEEDLPLDRILVVTFTRAATAELRDRIRRALASVLAAVRDGGGGGGDPRARELLAAREAAGGFERAAAVRRLERALHDIDLANVFTIHGFCRRVLGDLAFESGFPFGFEMAGDDGAMVAGAVRDFWRRRLHGASTLLARHVVDGGFLPDGLTGWVSGRRAKTAAEVVGGECPGGSPEAFAAEEAAWCAAFETARAEWADGRDEFRSELLEGAWLNRQRYRRPRVEEKLGRIEALFAAPSPRLPEPGTFGFFGRECLLAACKKGCTLPGNPLFETFDRLEEASRDLRSTYDQWLRWARAEAMTEVRGTVRRRIREDRRLGYDDLLLELDAALEGADGERLAERIRREYPCALIDEYQDTDPVQARIFARIYAPEDGDGGEDESGSRPSDGEGARAPKLFVVGDPKQSIYRFRGADVFAYLATRDRVRDRLSLRRNWRSVPALVEAVNRVFAGAAPFVVPGIEYHPVEAAPEGRNPLVTAGDDGPPFRFRLLPAVADGKPRSKGDARTLAVESTADEIAALLASAADGEAVIEDGDPPEAGGAGEAEGAEGRGRPLTGADVAVLVRTRDQGRAVAAALHARGVRCIEVDDHSVFGTREAEQLERLLWALAAPAGEARVRGALAGDLFGLDLPAVLALGDDEAAWNGWSERLAAWRSDWRAKGIGPLLLRLLEAEGGAARLLRHRDGLRRLTNFRHLAELAQSEETRRRLTPGGLAAWFTRRRAEEDASPDEDAQLRLESDEQLVKVLTVHGAKGLEFPVVFCPFAWDGRPPGAGRRPGAARPDPDVAYHRGKAEGYREVIDLRPDDGAKELARVEEFAESLRLLYVALTRAQYRCVVTWGWVRDAEYSPLAWLLHRGPAGGRRGPPAAPAPGGGADPDDAHGDAAALAAAVERFTALGAEGWMAEAEGYGRACPQAFSVRKLMPGAPGRRLPPADAPPPSLAARELDRPLGRTRQMTSFSSLSAEGGRAGGHRPPDPAETARPDHDQREDPHEEDGGGAAAGGARERTAFTFPQGPVVGSCLHYVFERLDEPGEAEPEAAPKPPDLDTVCRDALGRFGIDPAWAPAARAMVERTRAVRLRERPERAEPGARDGFRLADPHRRLVELEFHFPLAGLDRRRLAACLVEHGYPDPFEPPPPGGAGEASPPPIHGYLRGFVDLVVEHEERWYVLDYKSNWLGPAPADYGPEALGAAMRAGGYTLQYLIYLTALHRYLGSRLPGYEIERHLGGAFYLFVRGIDPEAGMDRGVHYDRPPAACIHALDACFRGGGA